uniref:Sugar fermentation stimulation protein homolog n=1 Tax=Candidatus Kentrum sp. TUN TaxID=2126343 RepID=A0A450ZIC5_9GAMM|nr:MAG: sugar fermentation stimulation protein A [Candidatus Kentron sp. TUN]VFK52975.1 MAG: sugar fermentation stimulation protein A [Candidatus Kentron sp. TUN]VFK53517.1 MAG: sugar fermentation stimulation protein A [Candidatus Kentron sp. TUN]
MKFSSPLILGHLVRRYKRFLADCILADGTMITAHCPNTGAMLGCAEPGSRVWLSRSHNPKRKYSLTWEIVEVNSEIRVGINTNRANHLVQEAIVTGKIPALRGYERIRREVRFGQEGSRVDLLLERDGSCPCYIEVKNVTAAPSNGIAIFPDAVTVRGTRHLRELSYIVENHARGVIFFCVQRPDIHEVRPADTIDPDYGKALRAALANGVEAMAWRTRIDDEEIELTCMLPVVCP